MTWRELEMFRILPFVLESVCKLKAVIFSCGCSYVYIPLLPVGLLEVLNTPTPFIAGVHTSLKPDVSDLVCTFDW